MLYTPSHAELAQHPKTRKFARLLGVTIPTALGHLHLLWHFALKYAPDGDLARFDNDELADGCMWEGDSDLLVRSLWAAGWTEVPEGTEGGSILHQWEEYGGKVLKQKESNAERQQQYRERQKTTPRASRNPRVTPTKTAPNTPVTVTLPSHNALEENRLEERREEKKRSAQKDASHEALAAADAPRTAPQRPTPAINPLWEALISGIGIAPQTAAERSHFGKAVKELRDIATPEDVLARCANYRATWPDMDLTPDALVKHWSRMEHPPSVRPLAGRGGRRETLSERNNRAFEEAFGHESDDIPEVVEVAWRSN